MCDTFDEDLFKLSSLIVCVPRQGANLCSYNLRTTNLYAILCASQTETQDKLVWLYLEKRNKFVLHVSLYDDFSTCIVCGPHQYSITLASFGRFLHLLIMTRCCEIMQIFSKIALLAFQP